jgi:cytochrome c-type biogenesis protein
MEALFTYLSHAIEGAAWPALAASFAWGVLSIVLSPCHLASIPLIVGFIDDQNRVSTLRSFLIALFFSVGILLTIAAIGIITAAAGRMMGDLGPNINYLVAVIFFAIGLHFLEIITLPIYGPANVRVNRKGILAGFLLGLISGLALGPCTFAYMAPMLGVTFKVASGSLAYGSLLLLFYGIGHCSVIVVAGTATGLVQQYLNWNESSKGALILKKICGLLVLCGGLYLIYTA